MKHQWLVLNTLDSISAVRRLVDFYVTAHNSEIPHSAFQGQTPDEMYSGRGHGIAEHLEEAKKRARAARLQANRASSSGACWQPAPVSDKTLAVAQRVRRLAYQAVRGSCPGPIPWFSQGNRTGSCLTRPPCVQATRTGQIRSNQRQRSSPLRVEYSNGKVQNVLRISPPVSQEKVFNFSATSIPEHQGS